MIDNIIEFLADFGLFLFVLLLLCALVIGALL